MSDRTAVQAYVYDCSAEQVLDLLDTLEDLTGFGELTEIETVDLAGRGVLRLGSCYGAAETPVGWATDAAIQLHAAAPDATFRLWEEPKYEWLGEFVAHAPGLGTFGAVCDSQGSALFTAAEVLAARQEDAVESRVGTAWTERIQALREQFARRGSGLFVMGPVETTAQTRVRREALRTRVAAAQEQAALRAQLGLLGQRRREAEDAAERAINRLREVRADVRAQARAARASGLSYAAIQRALTPTA